MLVVCLYRKQEQSFSNFMAELESFMDRNFHKSDIILLTGDFNVWVDLPNARHNKKLINLMNAYGLFQLVREPTHIAGHTLDH